MATKQDAPCKQATVKRMVATNEGHPSSTEAPAPAAGQNKVAHSETITYHTIMEQLIEQMINQMREDLKKSGDLDSYGETGIRIAVYEDLQDTLKHQFADVAYD
jgi:hypothetical protein